MGFSFNNLQLRTKLLLQSSLLISLVGLLFVILVPSLIYDSALKAGVDKVFILKNILSNNLQDPLDFLDKTSAEIVLNGLKELNTIDFVNVYASNKDLFVSSDIKNFNALDSIHTLEVKSVNKDATIAGDAEKQDTIYVGFDRILSYSKIEKNGKLYGYLFISFSLSEIIKDKLDARVLVLIITLIIVIGSIVVSYFFANSITKKVNELVAFFREMADGKGDLTKRINAKGSDEFAVLAIEFNRFLNSQNSLIYEIKNVSNIVDERIKVIETLSTENNSLISDLTSGLDSILSVIGQLNNGANLNVESAKNATSQSEKSIQISMNGQKAVDKSINEMESIKNEVSQLEEDMTRLHERSKQIRTIADNMKDISDRTAILALNTSIEASKAGVNGSGFIVIAEEIHRLSEQGMNSLEDINRITIDIQRNLDKSYQLTKATVSRVDEGMVNINGAGYQLFDSVESVKNNLSYIKEVLDMAETQKNRTKEVANTINESVANLGHIKYSIDNTLQNVKEQKIHITSLSKLMNNFKISELSK
jgi:methyl-accepting chemotaxis protein